MDQIVAGPKFRVGQFQVVIDVGDFLRCAGHLWEGSGGVVTPPGTVSGVGVVFTERNMAV